MYIYKAAVIGGGAMGSGIAQVISYAGVPVVIKEVNDELAQKAYERVKAIYQRRVDKGKMTPEEMEKKMELVEVTSSYEDLEDADIVIEAVYENLELKKKIFAELDEHVQPSAILASNTSALSITAIASATKRPEKVIGMHFFNPAHVMKLVEVIPGLATSDETTDDVVTFSETLRKIPIIVRECPGFLVNRVLMAYMNEAAFALQEGAATMEEIDKAAVEFGWPMGPFTLIDMLGIDVAYEVAEILYDGYGERMKPALILQKMVERKRFGQKSGAGFYVYDQSKEYEPIEKIIEEVQKETGVKGTKFSMDRLMYAMINEAVLAFQENVATAADIDMGTLAGLGFPQDKGGGPLHYADKIGIDVVLEGLKKFTEELGPRFWPAYHLKKMVAAGWLGEKTKKGFFDYA